MPTTTTTTTTATPPELKLDIFVLETYNVNNLAVADASVYPTEPPVVTTPLLKITPPGYDQVNFVYVPQTYTVYTSIDLGISTEEEPLPDGIYEIEYSVDPSASTCVKKSIMRVNKIQEKFDNAFMSLDMMECDRKIKAQAKVELNSIWFFIQGSIAAANNCAIIQAEKLYQQADKMLDRFLSSDCGCKGTLYNY